MSSALTKKNTLTETYIASMFNSIADRYDFLNRLLSLRQDKKWRKYLVAEMPNRSQSRLLDIATGTGDIIIEAYSASKGFDNFVGIDISKNMIAKAKLKTQKKNIPVTFKLMSAEILEFEDNSFDCLTIAFGLRNIINRKRALQEFYRVLKPEGRLLILEFFSPPQRIVNKTFSLYMNHVLPKIGALISQKEAYRYLPESISQFYSCEELLKIVEKINFTLINKKHFIFQTCNLLSLEKRLP